MLQSGHAFKGKAIDQKGWPLLVIEFYRSANNDEVSGWLQSLSYLLSRKQPFVVVIKVAPDSAFSDYAKKEQGLWFKQHKEELSLYCLGLARVLLKAEDRDRLAGDAMQQAMPFPLFASVDEQDVFSWAQQQLDVAKGNIV